MDKRTRKELEKMLSYDSARIAFYWGNDENLSEWLDKKDLNLPSIPIVKYDIDKDSVFIKGYKNPIILSECTISVPMKDKLKRTK